MLVTKMILCLALGAAMAMAEIAAKQKRCSGCGNGGGSDRNNGPRRSEANNAVNLRELLQLLPYLSGLNAAPVASSVITHLRANPQMPPPLGLVGASAGGPPSFQPLQSAPLVSANPAAPINDMIALAKILGRREANPINEPRARIAEILDQATVVVQNGSNVVSSERREHSKASVDHRSNATLVESNLADAYEFEDYGPPPPPSGLSSYKPKSRLGDSCANDSDCARGAMCRTDTNGRKHCECRVPFVRSRGRCVPFGGKP